MINVIPHKVDILGNVLSDDTSKSLQVMFVTHSNVHLNKRLHEVGVSISQIILHSIQIHDEVDLWLFLLSKATSLLQKVKTA